MTSRLSGHFSTFGFVFFMLKFFLGIARQWRVDFVGHRELAIFFKFFTIGREYTPLGMTIKIVSRDIGGTYHFHLGWVRVWYSGQFFQVTGMIEVCFFLGLKFSVLRFSGTNLF